MTRKYVFTHLYDTEEEAQSARASLIGRFGSSLESTRIVQIPYGFILQIDTKEIPEKLFEEIRSEIEPRAEPEISRRPEESGRQAGEGMITKPVVRPSESTPEPTPHAEPVDRDLGARPTENVRESEAEPETTDREEPTGPAPTTGGPATSKRKRTAVLLAVFLGLWSWLYTYRKDKHKFWISLIIPLSIVICISAFPRSPAAWALAVLLFAWFPVTWLWSIITAGARSPSSTESIRMWG